MFGQGATELHQLREASQKSPVVAASQSDVPHAQSASFANVPSVTVQVGTALQRSWLATELQMNPVVAVQAANVEPQTHVATLGVTPSPCGQTGAANEHRQA